MEPWKIGAKRALLTVLGIFVNIRFLAFSIYVSNLYTFNLEIRPEFSVNLIGKWKLKQADKAGF